MANGKSQALKSRFKRFLKRKPRSRAASPQPPVLEQENRSEEVPSVQHEVIDLSGLQSIVPNISMLLPLDQQDDHTSNSALLSSSQPPSWRSGLIGSIVVNDQYNTQTQESASSKSPTQPRGSGQLADRALSTTKDFVGGARSFTEMLLKKLPDAIDANPMKVAAGLIKMVLEIKDEVKGNMDAVDQRILSTVNQLDTLEKALDGWQPNKEEETQAINLYTRSLEREWTNLIELKKESLIRKIAVLEDNKSKIADIFQRINHAREQLVVATGLRVHKTVLTIQDNVQKLLLKELRPSHIADHKFKPGSKQQQLLRHAVCTPGTRVRILADIVKWANDDSPESQSVFWLFGQAGNGKTTIAYTIARRFEFATDANDTIVLGGNFLCSRQIDETRDAACIIRTIAYHLALRCKPFADAVRDCGDFDTIHQAPSAQLKRLLIKPWKRAQSAASSPLNFLVVIDALDEIEGEGGPEFLRDLFDGINKHQLQGLKFFFTSRHDPQLVKHVEAFKNKQLYRLEHVPMEEAEADIRTYLYSNLPEFVGSPAMQRLVVQAAGLFIYAATVLRYLKGLTQLEQRERIDRLPDSGIPQTGAPLLDALYLQILCDAFHRVMDDKMDLTRRLKILHTFLCSNEPISSPLAAELLFSPSDNVPHTVALHTDLAKEVLSNLYSVLYIESDQVFSYHKSFIDFIFDRNRAKEFSCNLAEHHQLLTVACFQVMHRLKFNIADIESCFVLDDENPALPDSVQRNIAPVLSYSCRNWDYHLLAAASTNLNALRNALFEFLQLRALFWIEAMNLLGFCGICKPILQRARTWVTNNDLDVKLGENLDEVASFALYFGGSEAASSTPHLYISVLATWPRDINPCQKWRKHFPGIPVFTNALLNDKPLMNLEVGSPVLAVAVSSNDRLIVSGSPDELVRVLHASTGKVLRVLQGHTGRVTSVAFSSNDKYIISGSDDKSVRVWGASTGKKLKTLEGHTGSVESVAFSSDDKRIISGSDDKSVWVWDVSMGKMLKMLEGHTGSVKSVAFSSNDKHIISGSNDMSVRLWNASTGKTLKVLEGHNGWVQSVAFSSDDKHIVSGSHDKSVRVWDATTGEMLKVLEGHTGSVESVAFSSDNKRIISGSDDKSVRVWDATTGEMLKMLEGHTAWIRSVAFSSDDKHIISGSDDESVRMWDASTGKMLKMLEGHTGSVKSVALSSNDMHIISGSDDKSVRVWDASTGKMLKVLEGHTAWVTSVAISSNDNHIISGSWDRSVRLWDALTGKMLKMLEGHTAWVTSVAISSNDNHIISGSWDRSVRVWDASTGEMLQVLEGHTGSVESVAFSSDDKHIISGSDDKSVRVWDASTGVTLKVLEGHTGWVRSVAFSSDNKRIISGSDDKSVRVWDATTGVTLKVLGGHPGYVLSVAISRDDKHIVSGSSDRSVRVWDATTGEMLKVLEGHTHCILSVAFSSDDKHIVSCSCSYDRSVRVWDASTGGTLKVLEDQAEEILSAAFSASDNYVSHFPDHIPVSPSTPTQPTSLNYVREKKADSSGHQRYTGWLLSPQNKHRLMFVPLTENLPDSSNVLTLPRSHVASVDFTSSTLGPAWSNCYFP